MKRTRGDTLPGKAFKNPHHEIAACRGRSLGDDFAATRKYSQHVVIDFPILNLFPENKPVRAAFDYSNVFSS